MLAIGQDGYIEATKSLLENASIIKAGIDDNPELYLLGDPLWVLAFGSDTLDIYQVMDQMVQSSWSLNPLQKPGGVHISLMLRHTQAGIVEKFIHDLRQAVLYVKMHPQKKGGSAPVYGMAATIPLRGIVREMLRRFADLLYKI